VLRLVRRDEPPAPLAGSAQLLLEGAHEGAQMEFWTLVDVLHSIVRLAVREPGLTLGDAFGVGSVVVGSREPALEVFRLDFLDGEVRAYDEQAWGKHARAEQAYRYALTYSIAAGWLHFLISNASDDKRPRWWRMNPVTHFPILDVSAAEDGMRFLEKVASFNRIERFSIADHRFVLPTQHINDPGWIHPPRLVDPMGTARPESCVSYAMLQGYGLVLEDALALVEAGGLKADAQLSSPVDEHFAGRTVDAKRSPDPIPTSELAAAFDGLHWPAEPWMKNLGKQPKWLKACVTANGRRGVSETLWNPVLVGAALVKKGVAAKSVRARFQSKPSLKGEWLSVWNEYEADHLRDD